MRAAVSGYEGGHPFAGTPAGDGRREGSMTSDHDPQQRRGNDDDERRPGKWPAATVFIVVLLVLFAGLAILAILGVLA